jgi:negative regulator of sigma E activity
MIAQFGLLLLAAFDSITAQPTATEIVQRMALADGRRNAAFHGYTGMRHYTLQNKRFNKRAEASVRVVCTGAGAKSFQVVSETGSRLIGDRVIRKMIEAEVEASRTGEHEQNRILPKNYDFRLLGTEVADGRLNYVLEIRPRTSYRFLIRGRIWVDAEEYAITRVEGSPAKNPSLWIRDVQIVLRYSRIGPFWLPLRNESFANARILGKTELTIDYFDYVMNGQ